MVDGGGRASGEERRWEKAVCEADSDGQAYGRVHSRCSMPARLLPRTLPAGLRGGVKQRNPGGGCAGEAGAQGLLRLCTLPSLEEGQGEKGGPDTGGGTEVAGQGRDRLQVGAEGSSEGEDAQ